VPTRGVIGPFFERSGGWIVAGRIACRSAAPARPGAYQDLPVKKPNRRPAIGMQRVSAHAKNLRIGRRSEIGRAYHVTATTSARQAFFTDIYAARVLIRCLQASDHQGRTDTLAFVVMPDHIHWLFVLREGVLSDVVAAVKFGSAHRLGRRIWLLFDNCSPKKGASEASNLCNRLMVLVAACGNPESAW
jgi:hypothetical protein